MDVCIDLLWPFLIDKVGCSFNYNCILQIWHRFLETTTVNIFLYTWDAIREVQVAHNELYRHFDLQSSPWSCELPGSTRRENCQSFYCFKQIDSLVDANLNIKIVAQKFFLVLFKSQWR